VAKPLLLAWQSFPSQLIYAVHNRTVAVQHHSGKFDA
jgi:hypothetical protein